MIFKKIIQFGFLSLILAFAGTSVFGQTLEISVPDSSGMVGDEIVMPVLIADTGIDQDVYSFELRLTYNSSRLQAHEVITDGTVTESFGSVASNLTNSGEVFVAAAGAAPLNTEGTLIYIRFELLPTSGNGSIGFNEPESFFNQQGTVPASFDGGWISIESLPSFSVFPASSTLFVGEELQMNVSSGTGPVTWFSEVETTAAIDENGSVTALSYGSTEITAVDENGVQNNNTSVIEVRDLKIYYDQVDVFQGNEAVIPVYLENPNEIDVYSGVIQASWSEELITSYNIETTGTLLENLSPQVNAAGDNFELAFAGASPLNTENIPLFYLEVETAADQTGSSFIVNNAEFNEGNIGLIDAGRLRVNSLPNLFINPSSPTLVAGETQQFSVSNTTGTVEWSVSDPSVATIDDNGLLTTSTGGTIQVYVEDSIGASAATNSFLVYDGWVTTPDTTFFSGSTSALPVRIDELPDDKSVLAYEMNLNYNSDRMTYSGVNTSNTLSEGWSVAENHNNGSVTIASAGVSGFTGPGTIVYLIFEIEPGLSNTTASFTITNLMLNEGDPAVRLDTPNIQITNQLDAPNLTSPTNNATGVDPDGEFEWEAVAGATHYRLQLSESNTFNTTLIDVDDIDETTYSFSNLDFSNTYYWRVQALMSQNESSWSSTYSFTIKNPNPDKVTLVSPSGGSVDLLPDVEFEWLEADNADQYELQVSESINFDPADFEQVTDETTITLNGLTYSTTYNWRVRGLSSSGEGEWSDVWSFTIMDPQPGQVILSSPANGATGLDADVLFKWFTAESANQYRIQIAEDNTFSPLFFEEILSDTALTVTGLDLETEYSWRVRAEFDDANNGDWSETWTFTTKPNVPGSVTLTYPVDETIQDEDTIEFLWQDLQGADLYQIEVSELDDFSDILFSDELNESTRTFTGFEEKMYYWRVRGGNDTGWGPYTSASFEIEMSTNADFQSEIPAELKLYQNYPNPFNPSSVIKFDLPESQTVKLVVYNMIGQQVSILADKRFEPGSHELIFDASSLTSGVYIYKLRVSDQMLTKTMTLIK